MKRYLIVVINGITILFMFVGCDDGETNINRHGDFYPMKANATWQYISEWSCDYVECDSDYPNWFQYVWGDTVIQGKTYTIVRGVYDVAKIARKEGSKYYEWDVYNNQEYLFLDTGTPPGKSWIKNEGEHWKTEIFVKIPLGELNVKGEEYRDIMVMREVTTYGGEADSYSYSYEHVTHHYYARGIGEILSVSPGVPYTYFNGSKLSLYKYEPK